jgi:hypothetical protein
MDKTLYGKFMQTLLYQFIRFLYGLNLVYEVQESNVSSISITTRKTLISTGA